MTVRRLLVPLAAVALVAAAFMIPFGSSSNSSANAAVAETPSTGYTIISTGPGLCDLYSIELATGVLTDLPATSSEAACANDLAVAPNGTVYGITGTRFFGPVSVAPAEDSAGGAELITFSADGTPSGQSLTVDGFPISGITGGSIAVDAAGTVYVIAVNETTCNPLLAPGSGIEPSDTYVFNCLYSVNLSTGALTQIGDGFAANAVIWGLTSCASSMWTLTDRLPPLSIDSEPSALPTSISFPWLNINPTTAAIALAGGSERPLGYDCLANRSTVYALTGALLTDSSVTDPAEVSPSQTLGTVDPTTGVFTPTVALSPAVVIGGFPAFAVAPPQDTPEPTPPVFTR